MGKHAVVHLVQTKTQTTSVLGSARTTTSTAAESSSSTTSCRLTTSSTSDSTEQSRKSGLNSSTRAPTLSTEQTTPKLVLSRPSRTCSSPLPRSTASFSLALVLMRSAQVTCARRTLRTPERSSKPTDGPRLLPISKTDSLEETPSGSTTTTTPGVNFAHPSGLCLIFFLVLQPPFKTTHPT